MRATSSSVNFHTLNNLLAFIARSDQATAEHVRSAINFTLENAGEGGPDEDSLLASAETILRLHRLEDPESFAFEHLDLRAEEYNPLFLRAQLRSALKKLAGTPEAILLITGLRRMLCPPRRNWTDKRQAQYDKAQAYIEDVCADGMTPSTRLHLLFL